MPQQMQGGDGEVSKEEDAASSEAEDGGDEDPDGILTRLQSAVDAMEARPALINVLTPCDSLGYMLLMGSALPHPTFHCHTAIMSLHMSGVAISIYSISCQCTLEPSQHNSLTGGEHTYIDGPRCIIRAEGSEAVWR